MKLLCNALLVRHDIKCAGLPVVAVEEENDEEDNQKEKAHIEPVDVDAALGEMLLQQLITFVDHKPRQDYYAKPDFHEYLPHTIYSTPSKTK